MINPRIGAVCLLVDSPERSAKFYSDVFGLEFSVEDCDGHSIYTGRFGDIDFSLVPFALGDPGCIGNRTHLDILVDDLDAVVAAVGRSDGKTNGRLVEDDEVRCIGVFDPDGNFMPVKQMN